MTTNEEQVGALVDGTTLIAAERRRQIEVEGWTHEHDCQHGTSRLLRAAEAYEFDRVDLWPWDRQWWKPKDALSNLIRAGALYAAADDISDYLTAAKQGRERCAAKINAILVHSALAADRARVRAETLAEVERELLAADTAITFARRQGRGASALETQVRSIVRGMAEAGEPDA